MPTGSKIKILRFLKLCISAFDAATKNVVVIGKKRKPVAPHFLFFP
ncbi:hypothetical protein TSAR_006049 [Trichomalopsis sarcophagae]|uniref:Uncharacterized protein n=1 Tax=Trichomalopsis sarcophagae TaxID=543379 RepID=A0A232F4G4_9HYME|nr:hypothetical protein TSAR_006049 [Trichomalopsis sarcophagae]